MPWWFWVALAGLILLVIAIVFFVVSEIKNRKEVLLELDDELFNKMSATTDLLISMSGNNIELREKLEALQDSLKYCIASNNKKVFEVDKRISNRFEIISFKSCDKRNFSLCKKINW